MKSLIVIILLFASSLGLIGADYKYKLPIKSSASVTETGELLQIECSFAPTKIFTKAINVQVDAKHAKQICYKAIKQHRKIDNDLSLNGLHSTQNTKYENGRVTFYFTIPLSGIKEIKAPVQEATTPPLAESNPMAKSKIESHKQKSTLSKTSLEKSLLNDSELEKYELAGYAVRCKRDIMQYFDSENEKLNACLKGKDRETLDGLQNILKEVKNQRNIIADKFKKDSKLLPSEIDEIQNEYDKRMQMLCDRISTYGMHLRQDLIAELQKLKTEEQEKEKAALSTNEKKEIQHQIEEYENEIKKIRSFQF